MIKPKQSIPDGAALRSSYERGLRYRKNLRDTGRAWRCDQCRTCLGGAVRLLALSKIDPRFRIADALAEGYGIDRTQMREDCYFAAAVDTIALYCGDGARDLVLRGSKYLNPETVLRISRTAPARQRYEIDQARLGRRPLDTRGEGCPVYDTVDFKEVLSRLRRAQGKLGVCVLALGRLAELRPRREEATAIRARLNRIRADTRRLIRGVRLAPEGEPCPCDLAKKQKKRLRAGDDGPRQIPADHHGVLGLLNQAHSWTSKCACDLAGLVGQVRPISREKEEIRKRGESVIEKVEALLRQME